MLEGELLPRQPPVHGLVIDGAQDPQVSHCSYRAIKAGVISLNEKSFPSKKRLKLLSVVV